VWIILAGAAPTVRTGQTVTRLMRCSSANLHASFGTGYACDFCKSQRRHHKRVAVLCVQKTVSRPNSLLK
jgi:hypothetical protein